MIYLSQLEVCCWPSGWRVSSARRIHTCACTATYLYFHFNSVGPRCICSNTRFMELPKLSAVPYFKKYSCWSLYMIDELWIFSHHLNGNDFSTGNFYLEKSSWTHTNIYDVTMVKWSWLGLNKNIYRHLTQDWNKETPILKVSS